MDSIKIALTTNKILNELFNHVCVEEEIIEESIENSQKYSYSYKSEDSIGNLYKITITSSTKENLNFTIYEKIVYFMLISNAKTSNDDKTYFISMRKLRNIRGIDSNSFNTYKCYEKAIESLCSKEIKIIPLKSKYNTQVVKSKFLMVFDIVKKGNRISEFNYSFDKWNETLINSRQFITISFSPFSITFKKDFKLQMYLHLLRIIFLNRNKNVKEKEFSFQRMLMQINIVDSSGYIENKNYYRYIEESKNKQSERLKNIYKDTEEILNIMKKHKYIYKYEVSEKRTFKYLRDNEVKIKIIFNK